MQQPTDNTTKAQTITAREALDHPATRAAVEFWQRFRQRGREDTGGLQQFHRALNYCMRTEHHVGYAVNKWKEWSRNPLWFQRRDFQQWPRYIEWVTTWNTTPREMPDRTHQCGSCENVFFQPTAEHECPECHSGNWVVGLIDGSDKDGDA